MEARDPRSRIRPLPPEGVGGGLPPPGPPPAGRWIAVGGAIAAVAVLFVLFGVMANDADDTASVSSTSTAATTTTTPVISTTVPPTTTTLAPTLAALAPGLDDGILIIVAGSVSGEVQQWGPSDRFPRSTPLTSRPDIASFDASGSLVMYEIFNGPTTSLHVGSPLGDQPAAFVGVRGALWHRTLPGTLAWAARLPSEEVPSLYTARAEPLFGTIDEARRVTELPPGARLAAFGDWGFAVQWPFEVESGAAESEAPDFSADALTIMDPDGRPLRTTIANLVSFGGEDTMVVIPHDPGFDLSGYMDPELTGDVVVLPSTIDIVDSTLTSLEPGFRMEAESDFFVSPDGEWLVEVAAREGGLVDVTASGLRSARTRSRDIRGPARSTGITADGRYLVLQDLGSNELILFGWDQGVLYRIPVAQGIVAAART